MQRIRARSTFPQYLVYPDANAFVLQLSAPSWFDDNARVEKDYQVSACGFLCGLSLANICVESRGRNHSCASQMLHTHTHTHTLHISLIFAYSFDSIHVQNAKTQFANMVIQISSLLVSSYSDDRRARDSSAKIILMCFLGETDKIKADI